MRREVEMDKMRVWGKRRHKIEATEGEEKLRSEEK
jgi:hypothetical protein